VQGEAVKLKTGPQTAKESGSIPIKYPSLRPGITLNIKKKLLTISPTSINHILDDQNQLSIRVIS
jgi:hypothetical protein